MDGLSGTITEIELMHTYLDTVGNMRAAIPNTKMMTASILNYSAHEFRRQDFEVTVSYDSDLEEAKAALRSLAEEHPLVLREPAPPRAEVKRYDDSAVVLTLQVWCRNADYWNLQYDLNARIKPALDAKGSPSPIPRWTFTLHIRNRNNKPRNAPAFLLRAGASGFSKGGASHAVRQ